jgi:hypothetical protein
LRRASPIFICQLTPRCVLLTSVNQAAISDCNVLILPKRRQETHCLVSELNSFSAIFNQLPCMGVWQKRMRRTKARARSGGNAKGSAFAHIFRKTTLQHARRGEDIARQIASDARVSESVLMTNYVKETAEEARHRSNRTYRRILASLSPEVTAQYGHVRDPRSEMESRLRAAMDAKDWATVNELSKRLAQEPPSAA